MTKFSTLAALAALLGPLAQQPHAEDKKDEKKVPFVVLKDWHTLQVKEPTVLVLKDQEAYAKKVAEVRTMPPETKPVLPKVEFDGMQMVLIGWSAMPSTGYAISVVSVTGTEKETTLTVKTTVPQGLTDPAITHPALAIMIPKCERVRVVVTGDRNPAGRWWKDFTDSKNGVEVVVKK